MLPETSKFIKTLSSINCKLTMSYWGGGKIFIRRENYLLSLFLKKKIVKLGGVQYHFIYAFV